MSTEEITEHILKLKELGLYLGGEFSDITDQQIYKFATRVKPGDRDCWQWCGSINDRGYGLTTVGTPKRKGRVHRIMHTFAYGPIPKGLDVCHECDNRSCMNPAHIWADTRQANLVDAIVKGRRTQKYKIPQSDLSHINTLLESGATVKEVAKKYGVFPGSLCNRMKKWNEHRSLGFI